MWFLVRYFCSIIIIGYKIVEHSNFWKPEMKPDETYLSKEGISHWKGKVAEQIKMTQLKNIVKKLNPPQQILLMTKERSHFSDRDIEIIFYNLKIDLRDR